MSKTTVVYPLVACLKEAVDFLKAPGPWTPFNEKQTELIDKCYSKGVLDLTKIKDIIDSMSTRDNEELMKFFKDRGFEFKIRPFSSGEFGVGSVLSVLVEWLDIHEKCDIRSGTDSYSGVKAKNNYKVYSSSKHEHPIVMLETKTDEKVYITIADKEYSDLDLLARIKEIDKSRIIKAKSLISGYDCVMFPMVNLDHAVDISWIIGININDHSGFNWHVSEAEQKTRFKMNHVGAEAESAAYMRLRLCCARVTKPQIIVDKPFFVWMTRPGLNDPLFVGYIDEEDWKDPGEFHDK